MKCIKCIKEAKSYTVGEIRRVKDDEAEERVNNGYWAFVPKSEWKLATRKAKPEQVKYSDEVNEAAMVSLATIEAYESEKIKSKKQLRKEKIKE